MVLYCFVTHQGALQDVSNRVNTMMGSLKLQDFIIVVGGCSSDEVSKDNKLLKLSCNDAYEGLPEKITQMIEFISNNNHFSNYKHFLKLDEDMIVKKKINLKKLINVDYGGRVEYLEGSRTWHIGRCSQNSYFNNTPYNGEYVPWCLGGFGYILSRKAIQIIADSEKNCDKEIYEDVYIAKLLNKNNVYPSDMISSLQIKSPSHPITLLNECRRIMGKIKILFCNKGIARRCQKRKKQTT